MVDHRRVKQILQSRAFREELDDIINEQFSTGPNATHLQALQQISDLLVPQGRSLGTINLGPGKQLFHFYVVAINGITVSLRYFFLVCINDFKEVFRTVLDAAWLKL